MGIESQSTEALGLKRCGLSPVHSVDWLFYTEAEVCIRVEITSE